MSAEEHHAFAIDANRADKALAVDVGGGGVRFTLYPSSMENPEEVPLARWFMSHAAAAALAARIAGGVQAVDEQLIEQAQAAVAQAEDRIRAAVDAETRAQAAQATAEAALESQRQDLARREAELDAARRRLDDEVERQSKALAEQASATERGFAKTLAAAVEG